MNIDVINDSWAADRDLHGWDDVYLCGERSSALMAETKTSKF